MSELRIESWTLPSADLGSENPLPVIHGGTKVQPSVKVDVSVAEEDRRHLGWGRPPSPLPYRLQDGFGRTRQPRDFKAVVLENDHLRAAFFPEVGGRLWSLVHKASGRELLSRNPVFQPCNLAVRTAWISGGVEWNIGWTGHCPFTCSPLFAARHALPDGTPALRMWEWERLRKVPFQIDAWLPDGSPVLLVRVSIRNPHAEEVPMYWWSNIAVEQSPDVRVLAPADEALVHNCSTNALGCMTLPRDGADDVTYPGRERNSRDCYFRVPASAQPWVAALDGSGRGLFETSTSLLRGRKVFRWGVHAGGRNWQRFLASPDYIEIQAGLARTQSHHLPMPPKTTWSWVEAYGDVQADRNAVHSSDWKRACAVTAEAICRIAPGDTLESALRDSAIWANAPAHDIVQQGSGWGALEEARRAAEGLPAIDLPGIHFPESSIGSDQAPWLALLRTGTLPEAESPLDEPGCFVPHSEWIGRLERSIGCPRGRHWKSLFHLGVLHWQAGRASLAVQTWQASCMATENPWARRCIGAAEIAENRPGEAVPHLRMAFSAKPGLRPLMLEYLSALLADGQCKTALEAIAALPPRHRTDGRVKIIEGRALLALDDLDGVERLLDDAIVPDDIREGETGLGDLWFELQSRRLAASEGLTLDDEIRSAARCALTLPERLDFRKDG